jgi:GT2 family glycosyltransferase
MTVDIIILSYTTPEMYVHLKDKAIATLIESEPLVTFNIILVESNKESNYSYQDNVTVIYPAGDFNYNESVTAGITLCSPKSQWIAVCNNDIDFTNGWFTEMMKVKKSNPLLQSFSPFTENYKPHLDYIDSEDSFFEGTGISVQLCGWCLVFEKSLLTLIEDLFDTRFAFWYQDDNYARCLLKHNIKHALVKDSRINHYGGSSHTLLKDRELLTFGQHAVFKEKYPN